MNRLKPRKALNKAFLKVKPNRSEIERFKANLIKLLGNIDEIEREENQKNHLRDFLRDTYYKENHEVNTKDTKDLVIHHGKTNKTDVGVIIEAKRPGNKAEMIKPDDINKRAFHEILLYYLRERITEKNINVKHLIVSNVYEWYIFDEKIFERIFAQNRKLVKQFQDFELSKKPTEIFYTEIVEPFIAGIEHDIEFTFFDIREYEKPLRNQNSKDDNKLIALFKLLSPEHLLKLPFVNDSNSLDKRFYGELLHIIGLAEKKDGSKKIIERNAPGQRHTGSLLENAMIQLDSLDKISRLENARQFGATQSERLFNVALELGITWINRILFLKLLEAQLVAYHKGDKSYEFLNTETIKDYDDLNSLFFQVLARRPHERNEDVKKAFEQVPYLNSSLFEPTEIEHATLFISQLRNDKPIPLYPQTVLKDETGKKRNGNMNPLAYLFAFLSAYDFASEGSEEIQEDNKTLINASVLGLIFEKINGYKDGSFFTPGFITMYMCRETIRKAVIQKFNETKGWNCTDMTALYNKIEDRNEANKIINDIKICDPAVGSGHFLVSALNELIAIKSDLNILLDRQGRWLKEYHLEVVNDELIVTDEDGQLFEYNPENKESQRVQETLFHEKQTLIENCLFGVDINANSVKICRLRLWIELLKNAYYKTSSAELVTPGHPLSKPGSNPELVTPSHPLSKTVSNSDQVTSSHQVTTERTLETLPNIDINIKCGNSLISRFAIDADLGNALKSNKWTIDDYRVAVDTYRNAQSKEVKREMEKLIATIKSDFKSNIDQPFKKKIRNARAKVDKLATEINTQKQWGEKINKQLFKDLEKAAKNLKKLEEERDNTEANKIYENAFEWRFEFPEVLDDNGNFIGFDVVIGNPPYIPLESFSINERKFFNQKYSQLERKYETSVCFILEGLGILNSTGFLSFIAPVTWQTGENYSKFRSFMIENHGIEKIINLPFNIFEDAYVDTGLYFISKTKQKQYSIFAFEKKATVENLENLHFQIFKISDLKSPEFKLFIDKSIQQFSRFDIPNFIKLGQITKSTQGLSGSKFPENTPEENKYEFPFLAKGNVYNFCLIKEKVYNTSLSDKQNLIQFYLAEPKILIRRIINRQDRLSVTYCDERLVFKKDINPFIPIDPNFDCKYLTGILASKFISFLYLKSSSIATKDDFRQTTLTELRNLPIPNVDREEQSKISRLVSDILDLKKIDSNSETSQLENQINHLVYQLYGLTAEEIAIIENS